VGFQFIRHRAPLKVSVFLRSLQIKKTGGFAVLLCEPPANGDESVFASNSAESYSVQKSCGDYAIHNHSMSALKTSNGCPSLWPDNPINYAMIIAELTQAALHDCNRCSIVPITRLVVRVAAGITPVV